MKEIKIKKNHYSLLIHNPKKKILRLSSSVSDKQREELCEMMTSSSEEIIDIVTKLSKKDVKELLESFQEGKSEYEIALRIRT